MKITIHSIDKNYCQHSHTAACYYLAMQPQSYLFRQSAAEPLFPDMLWSRPENRLYAGKLVIIGGHAQTFAKPAEAYGLAEKAGIGAVRILLPDVLRRTVGKIFPAAEFCPSTPSGSFSQTSLGEFLPAALWAEGVLLAGDFGRNSETAIVLEKLAEKYTGQLTLVGDSIDYFIAVPAPLLNRGNALIVATPQQLQKLAQAVHFTTAFTSNMDFLRLVEALHEFSKKYRLHICLRHHDNICLAVDGQVSVTKNPLSNAELWIGSQAATWWIQNPSKGFEGITTALL